MQRYLKTTHRSVIWFKRAFDAGELELKAAFQRNPVWTEKQKSYLIDTILNEYPIPELYVQEVTDEYGNQKYIVVDGQQRIRACLEFIEGEYRLSNEESPQWANLSFEDLTSQERKRIYEYDFVVRQLPEMPEEQLRAIFQRLNRSVAVLNQQELRHATYWGRFIKAMESIAEYDVWSTLGLFSANDVRRMLDIEFISEITVAFLHGIQNKKEDLDRWYAHYEQEFEDEPRVIATFQTVLGEIHQAIPNFTRTRWRKKSDFYTIFLVLANHVDELPLPSDKRFRLGVLLTEFSSEVNLFQKNPDNIERFSGMVVNYSRSVERAASDLNNRRERAFQLDLLLEELWAKQE